MLLDISSWIISIAGIICISVVVELILPEGQMNKYIKGIFSFIVTLVIIMPIPKLLGSNIDFSYIFNFDSNISVDEDYIYQLNINKLNLVKEDLEIEIKEYGYENVEVFINCDIFENQMNFRSITVDLTSLVISENAEHKDITKIKKDITNIILSYIQIDEEEILYDG